MAKETMQAVNEAEKNARQSILHAKEESERMIGQAQEQAKKLVADAEKEALKKVEVLCGVARADGEKLKARTAEETANEQQKLKEAAAAAYPQAAEKIKEIVLQNRQEGGQL